MNIINKLKTILNKELSITNELSVMINCSLQNTIK